MPFDVDSLVRFSIGELQRFANDHTNEVFYAFAIDAQMLCLNSEESFAKSLEQYQNDWDRKARPIETWDDLSATDLEDADYLLETHERYSGLNRSNKQACLAVINADRARYRQEGNPYRRAKEIASLRANTGDWAYQGFARMNESVGFDEAGYSKHYDMSDEGQKASPYGKAMDEVVARLMAAEAFKALKKSPGFYATRVEHNY